MRRPVAVVCMFALASMLSAQQAPKLKSTVTKPHAAAPQDAKDLPVRNVVLYKNGVGYFEHAGQVTGNQRVAIDFTSTQLNDVLQSLTVLDEGGGRVSGVSYNSTTPIEQQLRTLAVGLKDYPPTLAVYQALRGQRVEVTGAGASVSGRLVNVEFRKETDKNGVTSEDHYFLILVSDAGALRTAELTDAVSVRMMDPALQKQFASYLEIISSAQNQQLRHLVLDDRGEGQRQLRVSYISEVPVWKSTYRLVFPRTANGTATIQGWAVVDNTVGADWDNVQLSLVAGAPQSFTQPISQPIYSYRPQVPIAVQAQSAPTTHEAAEMRDAGRPASAIVGDFLAAQPKVVAAAPKAFGIAGVDRYSGALGVGMGAGYGSGVASGGGVYRASDAIREGDVSTNAFDDFFQYALTQPVTIHKNESAMVPILQQELPAEHVTLWSERNPRPLRAVWLENKSSLTLDSGSFSIFESGEFAGEGLLDPIHPGERRLLSYAADQAVRVKVTDGDDQRTLHRVQVHLGAIIETHMNVAAMTYAATNSADVERVVLIEHPRRNYGWSLDDGLKADETSPNSYRFRLVVPAKSTAKLEVRERGPESTNVRLDAGIDQTGYLLDLVKRAPDALDGLKPVIDAQTGIADLTRRIADSKKAEETATADEARARDNLTALKGNEAAKRFVDELNHAEDLLQATRKQTADLEQQKKDAVDKLNGLISHLSFDWSVTATK